MGQLCWLIVKNEESRACAREREREREEQSYTHICTAFGIFVLMSFAFFFFFLLATGHIFNVRSPFLSLLLSLSLYMLQIYSFLLLDLIVHKYFAIASAIAAASAARACELGKAQLLCVCMYVCPGCVPQMLMSYCIFSH